MILISDIHSRLFWKDVIPFFKLHPEECIVFMGDYVDPYLQDHVPENEIVERAADIFQFAANNKNNIILLQGNHDEVYLRNGIGAKCRFCHSQANQLFELYGEYKDLFKRYHVAFDTLFTHAGVTKNWLTQYKMIDKMDPPIEYNLKYVTEWIDSISDDMFFDIGRSRGGYAPYGSPTWADVTEHRFNNLPFKQIFSHTQLKVDGMVYQPNNKSWMIDSRAIFDYDGTVINKLNI